MQMVRQNRHGVDREWVPLAGVAHGITKVIDAIDEQSALAVGEVDGKEIGCAGVIGAAVVGSLTFFCMADLVKGFAALSPSYGWGYWPSRVAR